MNELLWDVIQYGSAALAILIAARLLRRR